MTIIFQNHNFGSKFDHLQANFCKKYVIGYTHELCRVGMGNRIYLFLCRMGTWFSGIYALPAQKFGFWVMGKTWVQSPDARHHKKDISIFSVPITLFTLLHYFQWQMFYRAMIKYNPAPHTYWIYAHQSILLHCCALVFFN